MISINLVEQVFSQKIRKNKHSSIQLSPLKIVKKTERLLTRRGNNYNVLVEIAITVAGCKLKGRQRAFAADK